jgi:hypothetical protein
MANLLDMQRLLGGTPSDMYQPPVPSVDEETQKLIDQVIDKEKRKPQALLNLLNLFSSGNQTAEQIIKERKERAARRRMPVDQERLLSPFRAQPVNPLQGQNFNFSIPKVQARQPVSTGTQTSPIPVAPQPAPQARSQTIPEPVSVPQPQPTATPKSERNQKLGLMLYALGGALKGDKNFVENTIKIQQMQESKKKKKAQKEAWEEAKVELSESNPNLSKVMDVMTPEQGIDFYIKYLTPDKESVSEIRAGLVSKISKGQKLNRKEFNTLVAIDPEYQFLPLQRPELFTFTDENDGDSGVNEVNESGEATDIETLLTKYD